MNSMTQQESSDVQHHHLYVEVEAIYNCLAMHSNMLTENKTWESQELTQI
jgi:hypothetical protein